MYNARKLKRYQLSLNTLILRPLVILSIKICTHLKRVRNSEFGLATKKLQRTGDKWLKLVKLYARL
jgi:hypothetical protein